MRRSLILCLLLGALAVAAPALAWRQPSNAERATIEGSVLEHSSQAGVTAFRFDSVRVSTVDRRYASAVTDVTMKGRQRIRNRWLLREDGDTPAGWRVIFVGTDWPSCKVAPAAVRKDLLDSAMCR